MAIAPEAGKAYSYVTICKEHQFKDLHMADKSCY